MFTYSFHRASRRSQIACGSLGTLKDWVEYESHSHLPVHTGSDLWGFFLLFLCCFTSTETVGLLGTGAQDGHLDFQTAP